MSIPGWLRRLLGFSPAPAPTPPPPPRGMSAGIVAEINAVRAHAGLSPLASDPGLARIAQDWAGSMAATGILGHGDFAARIATVHPATPAGEDVAEGYPTPADVVAGWMASPEHRANILGGFDLVGCGWAVADSGLTYGVAYAVADFDLDRRPAAPRARPCP